MTNCPFCGHDKDKLSYGTLHMCDHDEAYCAKWRGTKYCNCQTNYLRWYAYAGGGKWWIRQGDYVLHYSSSGDRKRLGPFTTKAEAQGAAKDENKPLDELEASWETSEGCSGITTKITNLFVCESGLDIGKVTDPASDDAE